MKRFGSITFIIAAFLIAAFTSCVKDLEGRKEKSGDGTAPVTLTLSTPALPPATRVQGTSIENHIEEIDVILFDALDNFYYRALGTNIAADPFASSDEEKKTFTVKLPTGTYKVVVLANARSAIGALATPLPISTIATAPFRSRADVLDKIAFSVAGKMGTTRFPMWGDETLTIDGTPVTTPVTLTRAIARVDVSVIDSISAVTGTSVRDKFEISSVHFYNYSRAGSVAPLVSGTGYDLSAPHLPALADLADSGTPVKQEGPLEYIVSSTYKHAFKQAIYACEATAGNPVTGDGWERNTCLVVGGLYNDGVNAPYLTYYRVEFVNTSNAYLALARNHLYDVVIQDVNGPGWPTAALAYANKPSNIVVAIEAWNDGGMSETLFNGQYSLTVDKSHLDFYVEGYAKEMTVATTYPHGWTVEDLPAWLEVVDINPPAAAGVQSALILQVKSSDPLVTPSREGDFYIVAGNLRKQITVTQSDEIEFWLLILDIFGNPITELLFEAGDELTPPVKQQFIVAWLPSSIANVDISTVPGTLPFACDATDADDLDGINLAAGTNGVVIFTVRPLYNPLPGTLVTRVNFSVSLPDGQSRMLPLYLRQEPAQPRPPYEFSQDGTTLTLNSNFARDTNLSGLNSIDIPELANADVAKAVTTLVVRGNAPALTNDQIAGIKNARGAWYGSETHEGLLPYLSNVSLPDFTGTIPDYTFVHDISTLRGCEWLKSFSAPVATGVGDFGLALCPFLVTVYCPEVITVGNAGFALAAQSLTTIELPKMVTIGQMAFAYCYHLSSVKFPEALTIGASAFFECMGMDSIDLPKATMIKEKAFSGCSSIQTLKLGHDGEITLEGSDHFENTTGGMGFNLYLGEYEYSRANDRVWREHTFLHIYPYN